MNQFLLIQVRGADPFGRGVQYGEQAAGLIRQAIQGYRRHFASRTGTGWADILEKARLYLPLLRQECPDELREAEGIAAGSGCGLDEILALNCRYEILKYKPETAGEEMECTTAAVLPAAGKGGVYLLQNWDYRPWVEEHGVVISIDDLSGTRILGLSEAGQLLRSGMNSHGVGLCANNLTAETDTGAVGVPVTFLRRKALSCQSYQAACGVIEGARRGLSCNFLVAGAQGQAVDLEATPGAVFRVEPQGGIITHANHMVAGAAVCTNRGKKFRDKVLRRLLEACPEGAELADLQRCMQDHQRFPGAPSTYPEASSLEAVCTHPPLGRYQEDDVWKTIASCIYNLSGGDAYICKGNPCSGAYVHYRL